MNYVLHLVICIMLLTVCNDFEYSVYYYYCSFNIIICFRSCDSCAYYTLCSRHPSHNSDDVVVCCMNRHLASYHPSLYAFVIFLFVCILMFHYIMYDYDPSVFCLFIYLIMLTPLIIIIQHQ